MQSEEQAARLAQVRNILNVLCLLSSHLKIYPQGNPSVRLTTSRLLLHLEKYFAFQDHLNLIVARHGFICDDLFVDRSNLLFQKFANVIFMHGVAVITMHSGVSEYELIAFLRLVGRNPAESWDEGGVRSCLEMRRVDNIEVVELSEKDFLQRDEKAATGSDKGADPSDLWNRFALGVFQRQQDQNGETRAGALGPEDLARETSAFLAEQGIEEQQQFIREVSTFLVSLQHENIRIYRASALQRLTNYINHLSPSLKRLFLQNIFNYNLKAEFSEDFFAELSDDLIMDALENAASGKSYIPPVVLNLLGKLARNRELLSADSPLLKDNREGLEQKTRELFRADEFEKYVPEKYRYALLRILGSTEIDGGFKEKLSRLKVTLEEEHLEEHTGEIIIHILRHDADARHFDGLFGNLEKILELYAEAGDYLAINAIRTLCVEQGPACSQALMGILATRSFTARILGGVSRFGKEKYESLGRLITAVGAPFVDPILDRLAEEQNRSIRYFLIQCLKGLGPTVAERIFQRLKDQRWYYLRNLLALLREVGDPSMAGAIRPLFRHPHLKVRHEAIKTGLAFEDVQAQRILLEQFQSKEASVVVTAVGLARLSRDPRIFAGLAALLGRQEIFDYHLELKRMVVATLVEIDQRQALAVLQRFLASHNLLHPLHHTQLCREIVTVLEGFDVPRINPESSSRRTGETS